MRGAVGIGAVSLVVPAVAGAATAKRPLPAGFVPFRSISAVRLGMDEKTVRSRLGQPSSVNLGSIDQPGLHGPSQLIYTRGNPSQSLIITFNQHRRNDPVSRIQGAGQTFRTKHGVGIGSSRAAARRAFPHLRVESGSLVGRRGAILMEIGIVHGRVVLISLADTRVKTF